MFSAWLNHTDAKAINSMDTLITQNGRAIVRHNLIDFNAALGSAGIGVRERRDGYEYLVEPAAGVKALPAFGFNSARLDVTMDYPELRGHRPVRVEGVQAGTMAPPSAEPAYVRSRPDDTFWGARKLMGISDELIRAAVKAGQYSDPPRGAIPRRGADRAAQQDWTVRG